MKIVLIVKVGQLDTGVGRYTSRLFTGLKALEQEVVVVHPIIPFPEWLLRGVRSLLGWDLAEFFNNYPVWARYPQADIYHITSQNLATLMLFHRPPGMTVITVHDIIPWLVRKDRDSCIYRNRMHEWFDRLALAGMRRAVVLVAVSRTTQASLQQLDLAVGEVIIVMQGVD